QTSNTFSMFSPPAASTFGLPYLQAQISATALGASATFTETTALTIGSPPTSLVAISVPVVGTLNGQAGQQSGTSIPVSVVVQGGSLGAGGVQGVAVQLTPVATSIPTISCASQPGQPAGTVLTNVTGIANCMPVFGPTAGDGQFMVSVGGNMYGPYSFTVTYGPPAAIVITNSNGNNQSGNPGDRLPLPLVGIVTDVAGNPLPGINVTWAVTQGVATLFATNTTTDANGRVSTSAQLGFSTVPVKITVTVVNNPAVTGTFTATVNMVLSGLQKMSGDNQDAAINTQFGAPLVVQASVPAGQSATGIPVTFTVVSGSVTVGTPNATTDANGRASTTVQAGATTGPVVITASSGTYSQTFNLTVRPAGPSNLTFRNGAGYQAGSISPCSVAILTGSGLATGIQGSVIPASLFGPLPIRVANVTVQFNNVYAPIYNVSNVSGQEFVTLQVPCETNPGTVPVTVTVGSGSATVNTQVLAVSPGIFQTPMSDGVNRAVLVRQDGTFVTLENPARRGEIIRMYVTGIGPVSPAMGTNQPGIPDTEMKASNPVVVGVNNAGVPVISSKYAQDLIGVYEIAFQLSSDAPAGNNVPLAIAVVQGGNASFGNPSSMPIQ
ncbi:MAG: hypothetical protein M1541_17420, partial [Acidobacteria bacterium]|nr:hypothetical protein [Acidobacteriota bacterium]